MSTFELAIMPFLAIVYGVVCYICGKGDLLNVIALMLQDKAKELEQKLKDNDENP